VFLEKPVHIFSMITAVEEALDSILPHIEPLGSERVCILEALGRVFAEDISHSLFISGEKSPWAYLFFL
jgi:hypothetical protein